MSTHLFIRYERLRFVLHRRRRDFVVKAPLFKIVGNLLPRDTLLAISSDKRVYIYDLASDENEVIAAVLRPGRRAVVGGDSRGTVLLLLGLPTLSLLLRVVFKMAEVRPQ
jgi:hypothetical protein